MTIDIHNLLDNIYRAETEHEAVEDVAMIVRYINDLTDMIEELQMTERELRCEVEDLQCQVADLQ